MRYLNLGCGYRFHPDWENVDFQSTQPNVRAHDLRKGIPYPDATFDVVYHSHVLEHFPKLQGLSFLKECNRVLRSGGLIRVVVPDLERIARLYIEALEKASRGEAGWAENYDWMVLEMYDQAVREGSRGSAIDFFRRDVIPNWDFVYQRWGIEAKNALDHARQNPQANGSESSPLRGRLAYLLRNPAGFIRYKLSSIRPKLLKAVLGKEGYQALQVGLFRRRGEVHQWMYDAYSLTRLLQEAGFCNPQRREANQSCVLNWGQFHLDTEPDGSAYKPDSLYMEATKP